MSLAIQARGQGPDLVLLHGWGLHSGVWSPFVDQLAGRFTCHLIDLPGHGDSPLDGCHDLDDWVDAVCGVAPPRANWIGWSLGGLVAQQAALRHPDRVSGVVLAASTPRFVTAPDWPCAVSGESLGLFVDEYETDFERVLQRFLTLQVSGSRDRSATLQILRAEFARKPPPRPDGLRAGLEILKTADFREALPAFPVPLYFLLGEFDMLIPAPIVSRLGDVPVRLVEGAGHAPFISHADLCAGTVAQWLIDSDESESIGGR